MNSNPQAKQNEYVLADDATLMSLTDTNSYILYANAAFVEASGYEADELHGKPHNVVRHPDMPPEAFADLWATIKAGRSWTGLVKNRRKNGDFYWVRANVTPIINNGKITGYVSVRTKPRRDEIDAAAAYYQATREGKTSANKFHQGLIVKRGLLRWMSWQQTLSVRWKLRCASLGLLPISLLLSLIAGVSLAGIGEVALLAIILSIIMMSWCEIQVSRPLETVMKQALNVAAGQFDSNLAFNRVDEIGMTLRAINQAGLNLRSLSDDVNEQITGLRRVADTIVNGNNDLCSRSREASSSLEQTATSMGHITTVVKNNAETSVNASEQARAASDAASKGGSVVGQVINTMSEISSASQKISDIIAVIDSIAFQTNILALNAAVEAARAGELGRGFAVVASEVRSLAQRSANAAKEIKVLINDSVEKVETGSRLVNGAGEVMHEIVSQVTRVSSMIDEISIATKQQSGDIEQINHAASQLDESMQQNTLLVRETTSAAGHLRLQTNRLSQAVAVFSNQK
jgi:aerotaxis receptor